MNISKIVIKNLFGISEMKLDGSSIEVTGKKGSGKTSILDAIRYALTNSSDRDYIVKSGETEGEIIVEANTGLMIDRKKRTDRADYKSIKEHGKDLQAPQEFLNRIFTPLQLNPVEFLGLSRQEQNRIILDLIEFDWDLNWIKEQFGEIPQGVDYSQNILQVLSDIQAEKGVYFQERQDVNRDIRNKQAMVNDIGKDLPENYQAEHWKNYDLGAKFRELERIRADNAKIEKAKALKASYNNKVRGLEGDKEVEISAARQEIAAERTGLEKTIERLRAELTAAQDKLSGLDAKQKDKMELIESRHSQKIAELKAEIGDAQQYVDKETVDITELSSEISEAEKMKNHLNEYARMNAYQKEIEGLKGVSEEYTRKIELARELPSTILKSATLPVNGLEVVNGIPLIHGLPVSNLSDGEKLDLCVDIAISKENNLKIILIDGAERLDDKSRAELYKKCKEKGLQLIATRTTNADELEVAQL